MPFISDYYWKSCFALCSQQCRKLPKALSFWLLAVSDLFKGHASLTGVSLPAHHMTPLFPSQWFFSLTRPVKVHFPLLPSISLVPVCTYLPNNCLWGLARINLFLLFYLCLSLGLETAEPALYYRMRQSLQASSNERPLLLRYLAQVAPAGQSKWSCTSPHTRPLSPTCNSKCTDRQRYRVYPVVGLHLPHMCQPKSSPRRHLFRLSICMGLAKYATAPYHPFPSR